MAKNLQKISAFFNDAPLTVLFLTSELAGQYRIFEQFLHTNSKLRIIRARSILVYKVRTQPTQKNVQVIDNIQEESFARFTLSFHAHCTQMKRFNQNLDIRLARTICGEVSTVHHFFFIHDVFHLDAGAVEQIRGCVVIFILVAVCYNKCMY